MRFYVFTDHKKSVAITDEDSRWYGATDCTDPDLFDVDTGVAIAIIRLAVGDPYPWNKGIAGIDPLPRCVIVDDGVLNDLADNMPGLLKEFPIDQLASEVEFFWE